MAETYKVARCDDGVWMVYTEGDIVAFAAHGDDEGKARRIASALNAATTFVPENRHGVKPGFYTRPDIVRLLRRHAVDYLAVMFIADALQGKEAS